jgi:hypothetical protein
VLAAVSRAGICSVVHSTTTIPKIYGVDSPRECSL